MAAGVICVKSKFTDLCGSWAENVEIVENSKAFQKPAAGEGLRVTDQSWSNIHPSIFYCLSSNIALFIFGGHYLSYGGVYCSFWAPLASF